MRQVLTFLLVIFCTPATLYAQYALQFGGAVTVNDGQILVGEGRQLLLPGNVFVYEMTEDGTWTQTQVLTPGGEIAIGFGRSLATENTTLAIGAPLASEVYIYSRYRGRDPDCSGPPAQIRTCALTHPAPPSGRTGVHNGRIAVAD